MATQQRCRFCDRDVELVIVDLPWTERERIVFAAHAVTRELHYAPGATDLHAVTVGQGFYTVADDVDCEGSLLCPDCLSDPGDCLCYDRDEKIC